MVLILGMTRPNVLQAETYTNYPHNYYKINIFPKRDDHLTDQMIYIFVLRVQLKMTTQWLTIFFLHKQRQCYLKEYRGNNM